MAGKTPSQKRALTAEEAELWAHAMRDAKALRRQHKAEPEKDHAKSVLAPKAEQAQQRRSVARPGVSSHPGPGKTLQKLPPIARFEDRQRRKLARNVETIDARLDLHGMRQRQAHAALRSFLFTSAARGARNVLIITGKGARAEIERTRDYFGEERGVLKRLVPQWLGEPELRAIVMSFTTASARHGGEGALYIRLRNRARAR